jgi:hypothetical protein
MMSRVVRVARGVLVSMLAVAPSAAQPADGTTVLTVAAGRSVDVVIDARVVPKRIGQPITGMLVQPIYSYDRVVVPAGTKVIGHVTAIDGPSKPERIRALLNGDLTPQRRIVLEFDQLTPPTGGMIPIHTAIRSEIPRATRTHSPDTGEADDAGHGPVAQAKSHAKATIADAKQRGRDVLAEITRPGRTARLKDEVLQRLPYHPQVIQAGTGYHAELLAPLDFGVVVGSELAPPDARPAQKSVLNARLLTPLDSAKTPRGTPVHAVLTQPVFGADDRLIFPEGTVIDGEVTLARPARRLHRNGQLRFLFERLHRQATEPVRMLASLTAIESSEDAHLALDDEGGATMKNSKTRFIAPALAVLALRGTMDQHEHPDPDGDGHMIESGSPGARSVGGFLGLGVLGMVVSHFSRPLSVGLSVVGVARTLHSNVLGRGREVQFPADTNLQLQLAPGPMEHR